MSYLSDVLGSAYHEGMTEEEISSALENAHNGETTKLKTALSKANSEAADYKKQLRAKQSADEAAEAERQAEITKLREDNATMVKAMSVMKYSSDLIGKGYSPELAKSTAEAMVNNDMDTVIANQTKFIDAQKVALKEEIMRGTPRGGAGSAESVAVNYTQLKEQAIAEGNYSAIAYYTRLEAQQSSVDE